uniref:Acetyl-CoA hydrolase/transferase C-terminal domain-containing protein n=1 Tax=Megaselia scalaris TaxID=36166 RepID=T1GJM9_MEGSC
MFRSFGDTLIHSSHIDKAVEIDMPLFELPSAPPDKDEKKIGQLIAENLVEDGSTLQIGIGKIPEAVLEALSNHKNLGIHTEMFSNGILPLYEKGCITNSEKRNHRGKIVSSFLIGDKNLYKFVDNNPLIELYGCDYTNSAKVISANPKVVAINSCIEVDLTGQICSDSIGTGFFSGFGGQVDFIRGASEGFDGKGKPIIAFNSATAKGGSKIVPILKPGAGVVTTRAHAHYVVTEYGIASLFGKNMSREHMN